MKALHMVTYILMVVGGVNWGLMGLFSFNLVHALLGSMPAVEMVVYVLVGVSAVYDFAMHGKNCRVCNAGTK